MHLADTHAHLEAVENLEEILKHAKAAGVGEIITIGTSVGSSQEAINIAEKYTSDDLKIYATVGMHPFDSRGEIEEKGMEACVREISQLATTSKKIVGIGEAGLDYYLEPSDTSMKLSASQRPVTSDDDKTYQKKLLSDQVRVANKVNLPLVVHCRNAWDEIFDELAKAELKLAVFHSFTGKVADAQAAVALGYFVSFSGIVTFKNAKDIQEAAKCVPNDKILVETDSPFLSPEPFRGQKNEPANVKITASFLSNLLGIRERDFITQTTQNAQKAFNLW